MICHGIKSNAHPEWWSLEKYKFGDVQKVVISYPRLFLEH